MVRKILTKITAPVRGLHQAAYLLAGLTLVSQVLALLRDRIFAHLFGAGEILDLYYAAFKIPDLVFALVVSLVSAYVLIPKIAEYLEKGSEKEARELVSQTTSFLVLAGGFLCVVLMISAPHILFRIFPAFESSTHADSFVTLVRLLLLQPILLGVSSVLGSVTQLQRKFFLFALSPVLYNAGIIFGTVVLYPRIGLPGIGYGVLLGAVLHLAIHVSVVREAKLFPQLVIPDPKILWTIMKSSAPRSLALAMGSLTMLVLIAMASRTGEGSVSVFTFAINLEAVPLSLIGAAYATAAFPVMSAHFGGARMEAFRTTVSVSARQIILWSSIITVLTIVLRAHIVRIVLGTGAFNWDDTRLTAAILAVLIVGLLSQGIILLASRAFYAAKRSWNPLYVQCADAGISVLCAYTLLQLAIVHPELRYFVESLLRISDVPGSSIVFIALGATVGQLIMGAVALMTLRTVAPGVASGLMRPLFEGLGAAIVGGAASYGTLLLTGSIAPLTKLYVVFTEASIAGMVGLTVASLVLYLLKNQEFRDLLQSLVKLTSSKTRIPLAPFAPIHDQQNT